MENMEHIELDTPSRVELGELCSVLALSSIVVNEEAIPEAYRPYVRDLPVNVGYKGGVARKLFKVLINAPPEKLGGNMDIDVTYFVQPEQLEALSDDERKSFESRIVEQMCAHSFGGTRPDPMGVEILAYGVDLYNYFISRDITQNNVILLRTAPDRVLLIHDQFAREDCLNGLSRANQYVLRRQMNQSYIINKKYGVVMSPRGVSRVVIRVLKGHASRLHLDTNTLRCYREFPNTVMQYTVVRGLGDTSEDISRAIRFLHKLGLVDMVAMDSLGFERYWGFLLFKMNEMCSRTSGKCLTFVEMSTEEALRYKIHMINMGNLRFDNFIDGIRKANIAVKIVPPALQCSDELLAYVRMGTDPALEYYGIRSSRRAITELGDNVDEFLETRDVNYAQAFTVGKMRELAAYFVEKTRPFRAATVVAALAVVLLLALQLLLPFLIRYVVGLAATDLFAAGCVYVVVYVNLVAVLEMAVVAQRQHMAQKGCQAIYDTLMRVVFYQAETFFYDVPKGEVNARVSSDSLALRGMLFELPYAFMQGWLGFASSCVIMITFVMTDSVRTWIPYTLLVPVVLCVVVVAALPYLFNTSLFLRRCMGKMYGKSYELLNNLDIYRTSGNIDVGIHDYTRASAVYFEVYKLFQLAFNALRILCRTELFAVQMLILVVIQSKTLNTTNILQIYLWLRFANRYLQQALKATVDIVKSAPSIQRLSELESKMRLTRNDGGSLECFDRVEFVDPLKVQELTIARGQSVLMTGGYNMRNTIVRTLVGQHEKYSAAIVTGGSAHLYNQNDGPQAFLKSVAYITPNHTALVGTTIIEHVLSCSRGAGGAPEGKVDSVHTVFRALEWAGCREKVGTLPAGIYTKCLDAMAVLTPLDLQRLCLAKFWLREPLLWIFHDCSDELLSPRILDDLRDQHASVLVSCGAGAGAGADVVQFDTTYAV